MCKCKKTVQIVEYSLFHLRQLLQMENNRGCFFEQGAMRGQFDTMSTGAEHDNIPAQKEGRTATKAKSVTNLCIYCRRRMPELPGSTMIQCSNCKT